MSTAGIGSKHNAEWVEVSIETGNDSILPSSQNTWRKTKIRCKVCGAIYNKKDKTTRKLEGPYICEDHPAHRLDFEFNLEQTPISGKTPSRKIKTCLVCDCRLSRYNPDLVCAPCIHSTPLQLLNSVIDLAINGGAKQ